jgi:hypothetical protein
MAPGLRTTQRGNSSAARLHGITALVVGVAVLIALTVLLAPGTAMAAGKNPDAEYYVSTVTSIEPAVPGLEVVVHGGGESITLSNRTGKAVVVVGYSGEDYLRIDGSGVQVNTNSPTAALNAGGGRSGVPATLSGKSLPVKWRSVGHTTSYTWQDFRPRWGAEQRPPIVSADPHARHQVFAWAIQLKVDAKPALVRGEVTWTGTPWLSRTALLAGGAAVLFLILMLALVAIGSRRRTLRRRSSRVIPWASPAQRPTHSTGAR